MARSAILGNGALTVGINEEGLVQDFYYPYVGEDNLNSARIKAHQLGVWIDGSFNWVTDDCWDANVDTDTDMLASVVMYTNKESNVVIAVTSYVDVSTDAFVRRVSVTNESKEDKEIRLFFHQVFEISKSGRQDTALYEPDGHYLLDYKGSCSLLIKAMFDDGENFDQYAVGNQGIEGKEGTYRDAEDGELSMSNVEHAGVDSTLRMVRTVKAGKIEKLQYWVIAADSQYDAHEANQQFMMIEPSQRLQQNKLHWLTWLKPALPKLKNLSEDQRSAAIKSLYVVKAHCDKRGGIIASCDSSIYNYGRDYYSYVWPRDGAYALRPLLRLGLFEEAKNFFEFCKNIIHPDGYMLHKYQPDGAIGSTWHPLLHGKNKELALQEDETAIIIISIAEYMQHSGDTMYVAECYQTLIKPMANFLAAFYDEQTQLPHASYDLWEEKFSTSTYTTAATIKALRIAASMARDFGFDQDAVYWGSTAGVFSNASEKLFSKSLGSYIKGYKLNSDNGDIEEDRTIDVSSVYGAYYFDLENDPDKVNKSIAKIESTILDKSPSGGCPRYENDGYFKSDPAYKGNPWFVTTLWMAQIYSGLGQKKKAKKQLRWAMDNISASGMMSEQINPETKEHTGVTPLVWSHAELINTILDLS